MLEPARPTLAAPELSAGLSDLTARLRAEWRDDEDDWTRAAVQRWAHERRLSDFARELAARGDRVVVEVSDRRFDGAVVAVGDDRLDLSTIAGIVTLRLALGDAHAAPLAPMVMWRSAPARAGGVRVPSALVTFRARLLELEAEGRPVRVGSVMGGEYLGRVTVGRDHVLVHRAPATPAPPAAHAAPEVAVPACWVAYVAVDAGDAGA